MFVRTALVEELQERKYPLTLGSESAKRGEESSHGNSDGREAQNVLVWGTGADLDEDGMNARDR